MKIPKALREQVWILKVGQKFETKCKIVWCTNRMNVFEIQAPTLEQARSIAYNLYQGIRGEHDWGKHFNPEPFSDVLDTLAEMPPREMRRALMTGFGNARLASHGSIQAEDLPKHGHGKSRIGFLQ